LYVTECIHYDPPTPATTGVYVEDGKAPCVREFVCVWSVLRIACLKHTLTGVDGPVVKVTKKETDGSQVKCGRNLDVDYEGEVPQ
jgi:hypothetical protein